MNPPTTLLGQVRGLLTAAQRAYAGSAQADEVGAIVRRLDEPLRVAIAGKVKAGKSTLLNALVGEELAPTNAGECTKIVTWYCDGLTYRVTLHPHQGDARTVPFTRDGGAVDVHLGACDADSVERLVVEWPSSSLRTMTLIDTPGIASLSTSVSARTHAFLSSSDEQVTPADAVLYLMRHLHASDIDFLETFHDQEFSQPSPVNAIAVLSRADEIGVGRLDAMASAARIAERYRGDDKVRRLCQTVVPVAGLLAQSGQGLREDEYKRFEALRRAPGAEVDALLLSADRFAGTPTTATGLTPIERRDLLDRYGLYGIRVGLALLRDGEARTSSELADALVARSGLDQLRAVLVSQFAARRDTLKARSALLAMEAVLRRAPAPAGAGLESELERITAGAHEFTEIRLLNALRSGAVDVRPAEAVVMERLLGGAGASIAARLGVPETASADERRAALDLELARWQRRAENPLSSREVADAARELVRTCAGIFVTLQR